MYQCQFNLVLLFFLELWDEVPLFSNSTQHCIWTCFIFKASYKFSLVERSIWNCSFKWHNFSGGSPFQNASFLGSSFQMHSFPLTKKPQPMTMVLPGNMLKLTKSSVLSLNTYSPHEPSVAITSVPEILAHFCLTLYSFPPIQHSPVNIPFLM